MLSEKNRRLWRYHRMVECSELSMTALLRFRERQLMSIYFWLAALYAVEMRFDSINLPTCEHLPIGFEDKLFCTHPSKHLHGD